MLPILWAGVAALCHAQTADSTFHLNDVVVTGTRTPKLLKDVPKNIPRYEEICSILPAFDKIEAIDPALVPKTSLLREFIGGGIYKY